MSPINQMKQLVSDGLTNGFDFMSGAVLAVDDVNFATVNTAKKFAAELYEALEKSPGRNDITLDQFTPLLSLLLFSDHFEKRLKASKLTSEFS